MMRNGCLLFFLLMNLLLGYAVAMPLAENPLEQNEKTSVEWNGDSTQIYNNLIAEENDDSHYGPNVAGMVIGGLLVGGGTFFSVVAVNAASDADWLSAVGAGLFTAASVPFYLVGLPIFLYNTYKFAVRKGHANRRDEYIDALKRYKERQRESSVEWMLVPSVDLANAGGGLNLLVAF
ncbi:hypothetical protein SAMN05720469_12531 [Fibrobacter intestinalis]|uniref:Uncharacterized protein n=1 Tax=Fibrobacter intestinalis TaxID=28122 RepID=A0A1M6WLY9_9BACT|nr:hypothetical protein [Fibrobacter intestinalis]SHK94594.1 hypothetical protein SAMN05720469_12531 [Fibrobacter intestinalis]